MSGSRAARRPASTRWRCRTRRSTAPSCKEWLANLLQAEGAEEETAIAKAIDEIFAHGPELRRLRFMRDLLGGGRRPQSGDLPSRLDPWIFDGEHAWLFDNRDDELDFDNRVIGFDMTELLEDRRLRTPVLLYLFHRIDDRLDGAPTMILIDEAWKALDDPMFAARIRNWMKTLRKRNAMIGFATQSAADALDSSIASAIVEQTATAIFMPNNKAREEHYCTGFGLSAQELDFIRSCRRTAIASWCGRPTARSSCGSTSAPCPTC